jgi:hypothetical protein
MQVCDACKNPVKFYYRQYDAKFCLDCVKTYKIKRISGPWFPRTT